MCNVIVESPYVALKSLPQICDAMVYYRDPGEELEATFKAILTTFKATIGKQWEGYYRQFPESLRFLLNGRFGL